MTTRSDNSNCGDRSFSFPSFSVLDPVIDDNQMNVTNVFYWINSIQFTRPKNPITRDFSDATMVAEIIKCYWPKRIHLHHYAPASSLSDKMRNWETLNRKVLKKIKLPSLSEETIEKLSTADTSTVFQFLTSLKRAVDERECKIQRRLGKNQHLLVNVMVDGDMIQVLGSDYHPEKWVNNDAVRFINNLKHEIVGLEQKIEHMGAVISAKCRRINDLESQLCQMKNDKSA